MSETSSRKDFGPLEEEEVMGAIWRAGGPVSVRKVVDELNGRRPKPLAYTTVMTVMTRLASKGVLRRRRAGRGYAYEAEAPDAAGLAVNDVLRTHGHAAVAHFVDQAGNDPALLRRLRQLLEEPDG